LNAVQNQSPTALFQTSQPQTNSIHESKSSQSTATFRPFTQQINEHCRKTSNLIKRTDKPDKHHSPNCLRSQNSCGSVKIHVLLTLDFGHHYAVHNKPCVVHNKPCERWAKRLRTDAILTITVDTGANLWRKIHNNVNQIRCHNAKEGIRGSKSHNSPSS
jgi:hypothetical protein